MSSGRRRSRVRRCTGRWAWTRVFAARARGAAGGRGRQRSGRRRRPQEAADALVPPRHQVSGEWTLDLGGGRQVLLVNVGPGHTGHDLAVLVPARPRRRSSSAATWSRSPASPRPAPTPYRPTGPPPWTGCSTWAARTRCTCPVTERWWTRGSYGPSATPWPRVRRVPLTADRAGFSYRHPNAPVLPGPDPAVEEAQARPRGSGGPGLVVEEPGTGFCGAVIRCEAGHGDPGGPLRQAPRVPHGAARLPAGGPDGHPRRPASGPPLGPRPPPPVRSPSPAHARAWPAPGRIYVEGRHDAELVEKVWGDDLRVEGVVVEYLEGVDDLPAIVEAFAPAPMRGWASWWTTWCPGPRSPGSRGGHERARPGGRPPVHRHLGGGEARPCGFAAGRGCRAARTGRRACAGPWAGRKTPARPGSGSSGGAVVQGPGAGAAGTGGGSRSSMSPSCTGSCTTWNRSASTGKEEREFPCRVMRLGWQFVGRHVD